MANVVVMEIVCVTMGNVNCLRGEKESQLPFKQHVAVSGSAGGIMSNKLSDRLTKRFMSQEWIDRIQSSEFEEPSGLLACSPELYKQLLDRGIIDVDGNPIISDNQ